MIGLIQILRDGTPAERIAQLPSEAEPVLAMSRDLYVNIGYAPPWVSYLAMEDERCVGTCAFKGPPQRTSLPSPLARADSERVEIAYYTFPGHEGRGVASAMAEALIELARGYDPQLLVAAQTLPEESASTRLLTRMGFRRVATLQHPEDGPVWEWQLPPA